MWRTCVSLCLFAIMILLSGCGGGSSPMVSSQPVSIVFNGNYEFAAISQSSPANNFFLRGFLRNNSTGSFDIPVSDVNLTNTCLKGILSSLIATLSGKVDSGGSFTLKLTAAPSTDQMNINATISQDGQTISNGSYTIGRDCADSGTVTGFAVRPFTGTYKGSVKTSSGTVGATLVIDTQGSATTAFGSFPLTGSVVFTNTGICDPTLAGFFGPQLALNGSAAGASVSLHTAPNPEFVAVEISGLATSGTANTIQATARISTCIPPTITLTRQ